MADQIASKDGSLWAFDGDIPIITGSVIIKEGSIVLNAQDIQIGAVEIKDAESSERVLVQGSRLQTNALGSFYILGTGSVQVTNTPSFSGAGVFTILGSVHNTAGIIGSVAKVEKHPVETFDLNASFSFFYDANGLSGMQMYTREGSNYQQDFLRSGNADLIFLSSWY